jgi:phosphoheptose isomerase
MSGQSFEPLERRVLLSLTLAGEEFHVNGVSDYSQQRPSVAMDADGDFVVVWNSFGGYTNDLYARRFDAAGEPLGGDVLVNSTRSGNHTNRAVAMDADGDFVVVWSEFSAGDFAIKARRYGPDGAALGPEFRVTEAPDREPPGYSVPVWPSVAMDADGDFVVAWVSHRGVGFSYDVYARRFEAAGNPRGGQVLVDTISGEVIGASVAMDADGDFVVAYNTHTLASGGVVAARRYSAAGVPAGGAFRVNQFARHRQGAPCVAMDADGDFVVAWDSHGDSAVAKGVYARRFTAAGAPAGDEFRVNEFTDGEHHTPSAAMDADGDFLIAFRSSSFLQPPSHPTAIYARQYDAAGAPVGGQVQVSTNNTGGVQAPAAALDADGEAVVVWQRGHLAPEGPDIYARRLSFDGFVLPGDIDGDRRVDGTDFAILARNFGRTGLTSVGGDLNGDGTVNGSDFAILARNFGKTAPAPAETAPAPAAAAPGAPALRTFAPEAEAAPARPARAAGATAPRGTGRRVPKPVQRPTRHAPLTALQQ